MTARLLSFLIAALLSSAFAVQARAADETNSLSIEDKRYLDGLMNEFLFDPKGAERVAVKIRVRSVRPSTEETMVEAWFLAGKDGMPGRIFATDGALIPALADKELQKVDFQSVCKARYSDSAKKKKANEESAERLLLDWRIKIGEVALRDITLAAWLYRLGNERLAARALAAARKISNDPRKDLREELAWSAYARMVHAYMVRADEEALAHGERLQRLYAVEAQRFVQAPRIIEDLKRRQKNETFGKMPAEKWPDGFDAWEARKKIAYLIDTLDEVDARQLGQPAGVDLASDRRVAELVRLGDAAVPALIDVLENDERLTRSVHYWRDFHPSRTVLDLREAALTALMGITRVRLFAAASTGDNFTSHGRDLARATANHLRAYWKQYGAWPLDERMMKVLTNPKENSETRREAAVNLASFNWDHRMQTTIEFLSFLPGREPNLVVRKFSKPTVAEAILASMDADLQAHDAQPQGPDLDASDDERNRIENAYLWALKQLGDERIAVELAKRTADAEARRQRGPTVRDLDDPKTFRTFVEDFRAGKVVLRNGASHEFSRILRALNDAGTPEANRALDTLANTSHPQHDLFVHKIFTEESRGFSRGPWFTHPVCLAILRQALDDVSPTRASYSVEKNTLWRRFKIGGFGKSLPPDLGRPLPAYLANPDDRQKIVQERVCDLAAEKLADLVAGLPSYHPILKNADKRLSAFKTAFDRFAGHYRSVIQPELDGLSFTESQSSSTWAPAFVPHIQPLDRPATAADVKAGKAVFHLDGKGKRASQSLPAIALFKADDQKSPPRHVLIVQAEIGPDGQTTYGVIMKEAVRAVGGRDLTDIKAFADLER